MDYRLALITGTDIPVPSCQLTIHQPSIKEIGMIGEKEFFIGAQCLCIEKSMYIKDESLLSSTSNFQIFMTILAEKQEKEKKNNTLAVLRLLFPNCQVIFTPRALLFKQDDSNIIIDENNFEILQEVFQQIFCLSAAGQQAFNPGNEAAKAIADKLMRARQRVAAQRQAEGGNGSVFGQHLSVLTVALHIPLTNLADLTVYQLYDLLERYSLYVNWDLDIRSRLAGGKPDSKPDNWMKIIH